MLPLFAPCSRQVFVGPGPVAPDLALALGLGSPVLPRRVLACGRGPVPVGLALALARAGLWPLPAPGSVVASVAARGRGPGARLLRLLARLSLAG
ncbi:MAG: hypothetical protein KJ921_17255 [Proteobacteria bacterium]|nr:hypothetical protein [Pseudomonadota bacterium]